MWRFTYNLLLHLALPFIWLRLIVRARHTPAYANRIAERFGRVTGSVANRGIWFHTVSAGEVIAAAPVIRRLAAAFPDEKILVSTMTVTGSEQVQRLLDDLVEHVYAPYDFPWAVTSFVKLVKPRVLILMETELWPNLMARLNEEAIPVLLINARMSERSFRGYRRISGLSRPMFASLTWTGCQYPDHASRLVQLGVKNHAITGSVKFDVSLPENLVFETSALLSNWGIEGRKIWLAASTHPGEEQIVLDAHRALLETHPELLLLIVPRHPERFTPVVEAATRSGFITAQISRTPEMPGEIQVLVGDEMGRLMYLYALADVVYMGGTLTNTGGHNIIEPASMAKALIAGPSRFNFEEIFALFDSMQAIINIASGEELAQEVSTLIESETRCRDMGERARMLVVNNSGAADRLLTHVIPLIKSALQHNNN